MTSSKADNEVSRFLFLQLMRLLDKTWILTVLASVFSEYEFVSQLQGLRAAEGITANRIFGMLLASY
jgi:hypothetical protein